MTAPATSGRTVQVGPSPLLLTNYAGGDDPTLFINLDLTDRIYLAGDDSVSPAYGVPVEPLTACPWTAAGAVWACTDPGDAAAAVVITNAISAWTPSPAQIAAQIAAAGVNVNNPGAIGTAVGANVPTAPQIGAAVGTAVPTASAIGTAVGGAVPVPPTAAAIGTAVGGAVPVPPAAKDIGAAVGAAVPTASAIGTAVGGAVPVPPTAAAIGTAVGGAVPVPPTAKDIGTAVGTAVPVPPTAVAIGTAVGGAVPVPPTAAAIGTAVGTAVPVPPTAVAIGTATATQANEMGVPPVGAVTSLYNGANPKTGGVSVSVALVASVYVASSVPANVELYDANNNLIANETFSGGGDPVLLAVETAAELVVTNPTATAGQLAITGGNFPLPDRIDTRYSYTGVAAASAASQALTAGSSYPLNFPSTRLQGSVTAHFYLTAGTAAKGYFTVTDAAGNTLPICDSTELTADSNAHLAVIKPAIAVPAGTNGVTFHCTTAGSTALGVQMTPCAL